jgi:signal transduction histidine kinase/DNA-binding response OmpR family regulator/purine-cytosine permease-like protein
VDTQSHQKITSVRRDYNGLVASETMEDYALRYAPRSFRKWSAFDVANTAFGSTSFLVLEAIGGFLSINYGFANAFWAILMVATIIFVVSLPISYYTARYHIDIDLLTRSAGFGYIGSTITSLIYAAFTITLFALEASIMSQALALYFQLSIEIAYLISAIVIIPLVTFGITAISRLQLWTQPLWLLLLIAPLISIIVNEPHARLIFDDHLQSVIQGNGLNWLHIGTAATVAFSMIAQIGEQVDFLRFMPDKTPQNRRCWWLALMVGGPGWIVFGAMRQLLGAFLADLAIRHGIEPQHAHEPTQMYLVAYNLLFDQPQWAMTATVFFVALSQVKINVTNAYAGSLAWSNFFSRLTHSHPGRVVWLVFNVFIAFLLMKFGVFSALEKVLGLFSHMSIAWICTLAAELMINKPLGLSPNVVEFKRAYLSDLNPVGIVSTFLASFISILAYMGFLGADCRAFSGFIAMILAFLCTPLIAFWSGGHYYLARREPHHEATFTNTCCICENHFETDEMAYCPAYTNSICSLCCTLDARCLDMCKVGFRYEDYLDTVAKHSLPASVSLLTRQRMLNFVIVFFFLCALTGIFIGVIYYQDLLSVRENLDAFALLLNNFFKIYASLIVFVALCTWWLILNSESRRVSYQETAKQTELLLHEIVKHKQTDAKLQEAIAMANKANSAKSRFLSNMSHEIRTPLNSIIGYAYLLQNDSTIPPHRRHAVDVLKRNSEHLAALIEDILDIARIEARKFEVRQEPIDFTNFIEHLVSIFKPQAQNKGLAFHCQILNTLPKRVRGDEKRVGQIIINLLSNAIKFTEQGNIFLRLSYRCGVMTFQIVDTGIGIEPDQLETIFQPFTQVANNTLTSSGSGLGLTISKILSEIMGGELVVRSQLHQGSTFTVRLFLPALGTESETHPSEGQIIGYSGKRQKILVVDDNAEHRALVSYILTPLGFQVVEAACGEAGLNLLQTQNINLVLLDLSMPGIDGIQTAQRIREIDMLTPIIILSANAYPDDRVHAISVGCNDFLIKPLIVNELLYKLRLHLILNWIFQDQTDCLLAVAPPSLQMLNELNNFVRIGDLLGLNQHLKTLLQSHPQHYQFIKEIQLLSSEFRLIDIKKRLQLACKEIQENGI